MKIEIWVKKLNKLSKKMEEIEDSTHPSAWTEQTQLLREKFIKLAKEDS